MYNTRLEVVVEGSMQRVVVEGILFVVVEGSSLEYRRTVEVYLDCFARHRRQMSEARRSKIPVRKEVGGE